MPANRRTRAIGLTALYHKSKSCIKNAINARRLPLAPLVYALNELRAEEDTWSCTAATICLKKLGYIPGHIKGRSASTKKILENVNLRSELKVMKESQIKLQEENKATK
ncbi:hypothetical protein Tco_0295015 [Tanacetum coccineum]